MDTVGTEFVYDEVSHPDFISSIYILTQAVSRSYAEIQFDYCSSRYYSAAVAVQSPLFHSTTSVFTPTTPLLTPYCTATMAPKLRDNPRIPSLSLLDPYMFGTDLHEPIRLKDGRLALTRKRVRATLTRETLRAHCTMLLIFLLFQGAF